MRNHLSKIIAILSFSFSLNASATEILVPAYFYPSSDPNLSFWDEMTAAASQGVAITAIMNPNSGPSNVINSDYTAAVDTFRAAGGKVIGYVSTQYGARDASAVLADVNAYKNFYQIDGIFLDEMHNIPATLNYYQTLRNDISTIDTNYKVFGNAGTNTLEAYIGAADVLITFENQTGFNSYTPDAWTANYSASHFANLLYNVSSAAEMQSAISLAASRNVGYVYVTNDNGANPWDTLPSYWNAEVAAVSAVPEPNNTALLLVGLSLLGLQVKRRKIRAE
ncbi:MAG TPA: spherulation-specific family 4 protein [Methylotenera sp.]|nr:spherulation-specific family 4 protein [Methylotenera sp.]HPH05954.1 spherulation-specific family 4 protein [Methylotenera sp.]HPN00532.1 spherulation-specific family 4 protein [Methylotenera sp.]